MAVKPNKESSSLKKTGLQKNTGTTGNVAKIKKQAEKDEIDFEDDEKITKGGKKITQVVSKNDDIEEDDTTLKKGEEDEENWDPDFDEFDLPKSSKKVSFGKKEVKDNDDGFKVDEEFQDYFNSPSKKKYNDADDDY